MASRNHEMKDDGDNALTLAPEATFFGLRADGAYHPGDVVLVGVPFDGLATERHGSAEAPAALRTWTRKAGSYSVRNRLGWPIPHIVEKFYPNVPLRVPAERMAGLVVLSALRSKFGWRPIHSAL